MKILAVYDNGGRTADRYTVILDSRHGELYECLCLSENCTSPQGVSQYSLCDYEAAKAGATDLGKLVSWSDVSETVQDHIRDRLTQ